jgi:hypothetical protein
MLHENLISLYVEVAVDRIPPNFIKGSSYGS